jgi:large subunit ribosomal protein L19
MKVDLIKVAESATVNQEPKPEFKAGDTVTVYYKIIEGNKEREQQFQGVVLQRKGQGATQTFTVRKISHGVGVERIFPLYSPKISKIEVNKRGKVRRARIFYLRKYSGKSARIAEKRATVTMESETVVS